MASPDFRINGSAVGVPVYVAASAAISATLDSTDGVRQVLWYIESTDETTLPANYTLVQSGSVGQTVTTTALTAGTAAKLRCRINNGVNLSTGLNDPDGTEATGKFGVLSAGGYAVGCVNETTESDGVFGWAKILNPIIRIMPAAPIVSFSVVAPILNNGTATVPIFALDYTEAATASKVPIRGASGELKAVAFQASTSTFEHNRLAFDSAVTGTIINSAGPITTDAATSQIRKIGGVTGETLTATSLTFAVAGTSALVINPGGTSVIGNNSAGTIESRVAGGEAFYWYINNSSALTVEAIAIVANVPFTANSNVSAPGRISPSIGTNQNNYTHASIGVVSSIYINATAAFNLTGMEASADGELKRIYNTATNVLFTITLTDQDGASTAGNRFILPAAASVIIPSGGCVTLQYNSTEQRWRLVAKSF